jgi:hypothetical protein
MPHPPSTARDLWRVVEPYHQLAYRSPAADAGLTALGLDRPDLRYFGSRLAAMGPVSLPVAVAVIWGFSPAYVGGAVPEVWSRAPADAIVAARTAAADATLREVLGEAIGSGEVATVATLARRAAEAIDLPGRPLAAAHLGLAWPGEPHLVLWHACTVLREHRGDAHWAATAESGLDAVECHVLHGADGHMPGDLLQRVTGWDDTAWQAATERLRRRGLVDGDGTTTPAGSAVKLTVEHRTDELAVRPYQVLDDAECAALLDAMRPLARTITSSGLVAAWELRERLWRDLPALAGAAGAAAGAAGGAA